jgi:GNAT superfamily N-acetyltransferase
MNVTVRRAEQKDLPIIQAFLLESFGVLAPFKAEHRWRWQFVENPYRLGPPDRIPVWIAVSGDKVVGQIAVQPAAVMIDRFVHTGGWIVDVMILPAYRGLGFGNRLYDAVALDVPVLLMLTMAPATRRMAERGGAIDIGDAWQFSRWVRLRHDDIRRYLLQRLENYPQLRGIVDFGCDVLLLHRIFAALANLALAIRDAVSRRHEIVRDIAEIERFGPGIDELWQSVAHRFDALSVRDTRYLNWRFGDCPDLRYRRFVAKAGDRIVGYSVLRRAESVELRLGVIADIFAEPDDTDTLTSLLDHALWHFGADVASIECVTSSPEIARLLRARGFFLTRTTTATGTFADEGLRAKARLLCGGWLFAKGDHDWDQIQVA